MADDKPRTIFVVSHPDHGERVGLWEIHPDHPNREIFVFGQETAPTEVALTPSVLEALAPSGDRGEQPPRLVRLEGPALEQRRALAKLALERNSVATDSSAVAAGRAVVTEVPSSAKHQEELDKLNEKLAGLEAELAEAREENAEALRQQVKDDAEDEDTNAQLTEEERAAVHAAPQVVPVTENTEEGRRATRSGRVKVEPTP